MKAIQNNNENQTKYKVLLGVTGCIAAYKSCEIVRGLQKRGCDVYVVMTNTATKFVGPATFHALTGNAVEVDFFENPGNPIPHITLAQNCDLFLIAPCTGNTLSKISCGIADNLLTSCALACTAPIMIAPAMNVNMYKNVATQTNIEILQQRKIKVIDSDYGRLACGDIGEGKLAAVDVIVDEAIKLIEAGEDASAYKNIKKNLMPLNGKKVLITSGPTVEPLDPVRFISNRSSGKMGAALARAAVTMGGDVIIISGPVTIDYPDEVNVVHVMTADEMLAETCKNFGNADIAIFAAAVSDYKPKNSKLSKIKKANFAKNSVNLELVENPDILASVAKMKHDGQIIVGFAAETNDILSNGRRKLIDKQADIIVCNEVGADKAFGKDNNSGFIITQNSEEELPMMSKDCMANIILEKAAALLT